MRSRANLSIPMLFAILFWGFNFVALKVVLRYLSPEAMLLSRFLLTWLSLVCLCVITKTPLTVGRADLIKVWYSGGIMMGVYMVFFFEGVFRTSPSSAAIILAAAPLLTVFASAIYGVESLDGRVIVGGIVALFGVVMVVSLGAKGQSGASDSVLGNLLILCGAILWAHGSLHNKLLLAKYSPLRLLTASMPGALLVLGPLGIHDLLHSHILQMPIGADVAFFHVAIGSGVIGFLLFYKGINAIGASRAVGYQYFTPIITVFASMLILSSPLVWPQLLGLTLVIGGQLYARSGDKKIQATDLAAGELGGDGEDLRVTSPEVS